MRGGIVPRSRAIFALALLMGLVAVEATRISIPIDAPHHEATKSQQQATNGVASVQAVITAAGVAAVQQALTPQLVNKLIASLTIPPITGEDKIDILGLTVSIGYTVANVSITNVTFNQGRFSLRTLPEHETILY
jgi:hypothetical protein